MPKKPKEIQERVDKLIIENYTSKEIIEILKTDGHTVSESYISSRRGKVKKPKKDENKNTHTLPELSNDSIKSLYNLMGRLGKNNLDETINTINEDYKTIMSAKYRYDLDNAFSASEVFIKFEETWKLLKKYLQDESQVPILIEKLQEQDQGEEILIINLTRNWPSKGISINQQLRNGVPSWALGQKLRKLYTESIVQSILDEINQYEDIGQIFQVNIQNNRNRVSVIPLTNDSSGLKQRVE